MIDYINTFLKICGLVLVALTVSVVYTDHTMLAPQALAMILIGFVAGVVELVKRKNGDRK